MTMATLSRKESLRPSAGALSARPCTAHPDMTTTPHDMYEGRIVLGDGLPAAPGSDAPSALEKTVVGALAVLRARQTPLASQRVHENRWGRRQRPSIRSGNPQL